MALCVFKMVTEARCCGVNFAFSKGASDLVPDFGVRLDKRTSVDRPAMESQRGFGGDKARRFHLLGPQPIVGRDHELRVGGPLPDRKGSRLSTSDSPFCSVLLWTYSEGRRRSWSETGQRSTAAAKAVELAG